MFNMDTPKENYHYFGMEINNQFKVLFGDCQK